VCAAGAPAAIAVAPGQPENLGTIDGLLLLGSEGSPGMPGGIEDETG